MRKVAVGTFQKRTNIGLQQSSLQSSEVSGFQARWPIWWAVPQQQNSQLILLTPLSCSLRAWHVRISNARISLIPETAAQHSSYNNNGPHLHIAGCPARGNRAPTFASIDTLRLRDVAFSWHFIAAARQLVGLLDCASSNSANSCLRVCLFRMCGCLKDSCSFPSHPRECSTQFFQTWLSSVMARKAVLTCDSASSCPISKYWATSDTTSLFKLSIHF